jgi:hypothetical protein
MKLNFFEKLYWGWWSFFDTFDYWLIYMSSGDYWDGLDFWVGINLDYPTVTEESTCPCYHKNKK